MPFTYRIDASRRLVVITVEGHVTGDTFRRAVASLDGLADPSFDRIWAGREGQTELDLSPADLDLLADLAYASYREGRRICIVATRDMEEMAALVYKAYAQHRSDAELPIYVAPSIGEALEWLGRRKRPQKRYAAPVVP